MVVNETDSHYRRCLIVDDLSVRTPTTELVSSVSLSVEPGSVHCLVGESGSGKTMTSLAAVGLLPRSMTTGGAIHLAADDANLLDRHEAAWAELRGRDIGYIGQNALGCLHPAYSIGFQVVEAIRRHQPISNAEAHDLALRELAAVDLDDPERVANARPAQLSGGMCQRVALAIALCNRPAVLIADEPTTALDDDTQRHVLELIMSRAAEDHLGVLLITHDQDVVTQVADEVTTIANGRSTPGRSPTPVRAERRRNPAMTGADEEPTLVIESVSKTFRKRHRLRQQSTTVLTDATITAPARSTVGLIGRSGAGKTTLARIVAGILAPSEGTVHIDGRPITGGNAVGRIEKAGLVQYVFQDPYGSLNPRRAAVAQVAEPLVVAGTADAEARRQAADMLDKVGVSAAQGRRRPGELSGGQCQRVGLARALIRRPKVVVLDEPVSALDWSIRREILDLLGELQDELDATYLLISHERPLVDALCDDIYEIADGHLSRL
ncbi:MAG: ABC transporter ATP-binding protein [Actinomycetota bacterium]